MVAVFLGSWHIAWSVSGPPRVPACGDSSWRWRPGHRRHSALLAALTIYAVTCRGHNAQSGDRDRARTRLAHAVRPGFEPVQCRQDLVELVPLSPLQTRQRVGDFDRGHLVEWFTGPTFEGGQLRVRDAGRPEQLRACFAKSAAKLLEALPPASVTAVSPRKAGAPSSPGTGPSARPGPPRYREGTG